MNTISINITALVDDSFPGWVECEMIDANGVLHQFVEKVPVVSNENFQYDHTYPQDGTMACAVISKWKDEQGRELARIDTSQPWGMESKAGITEFVILAKTIHSIE